MNLKFPCWPVWLSSLYHFSPITLATTEPYSPSNGKQQVSEKVEYWMQLVRCQSLILQAPYAPDGVWGFVTPSSKCLNNQRNEGDSSWPVDFSMSYNLPILPHSKGMTLTNWRLCESALLHWRDDRHIRDSWLSLLPVRWIQICWSTLQCHFPPVSQSHRLSGGIKHIPERIMPQNSVPVPSTSTLMVS